ncbi:MAG: phosphodiester glycosidase family protein [Oscillospiraceae bacterium]|nr:phosphodiester glycosidase family protein [Oscillospiraceae bacterium]
MAEWKRLSAWICIIALMAGIGSVAASAEPYTDAWGYTDEDGDGLILVTVPWETCTAYMLIVLDPTRVVLGCRPDKLYARGYTVEEYVKQFHAVAGINAGGFADEGGNGNGSVPEHAIVSNGEIYCNWSGVGEGFAGLDADGKLHLGFQHVEELIQQQIKEGAGYGPILVQDGEAIDPSTSAFSYWIDTLNPRTAIGQRSDNAILLLVFDGRQPSSLGASFADETELMLRFGAVNAANLDGGNSSMMWFDGGYLNNPVGTFDVRPIPTSFVVLKQQRNYTVPVVSEEERTGMTREEMEALAPNPASLPDNCTEEEKAELESFAREYIKHYVNFSADANQMSNVHYYNLLPLTVSGGELQKRLHGAFGSFGYAFVKSVSVLSVKEDFCTALSDSRYLAGYTYETESVGKNTVREEKNIQLTILRQDGKLYAESMWFY